MIANYNGKLFNWVSVKFKNYIMTYDKEKIDDFFEVQRGYFIKRVEMDDEGLISIREVHFIVEYDDDVECEKEWIADEGRPLYEVPDIEKGEIGISVGHDSRGEGWVQHDKNASSKMIHLADCKRFTVETVYLFENGRYLASARKERLNVSMKDFQQMMIDYRKENM